MNTMTTLELRSEVKQECRELVRRPFELNPDEFSEYISSNSQINIYQALGDFAFETYSHLHLESYECSPEARKKLESDSTKSGFHIPAKIISLTPKEYLSYCQTREKPAKTEELRLALRQKVAMQSVLELANMPNGLNSRVEHYLGLRGGYPIESKVFFFTEGDSGEPVLEIDQSELRQAKIHAYRDGFDHEDREDLRIEDQYCPARGILVGRVWPAMVDLAATSPLLFHADLVVASQE